LQPGDPRRLGAYELVGRLGEGGQGVVYLAMDLGERIDTLRFLIQDRDPLFTTAFGEVFKAEGLRIIMTRRGPHG
jgi:hypothetical protein